MHIEISLALPRDRGSVSAVRRIVSCAMAEVGVEESCAADVELALTEGCANVVRHATSTDSYRVTFALSPKAATVIIADNGAGFEVQSRQRMAGTLAEGGRGLALMRLLMDETDFRVREGRGTEVMLTKQVVLRDSSLLREHNEHNGLSGTDAGTGVGTDNSS